MLNTEAQIDLIWGAEAIAKLIGRSPRATFYMLDNGELPAKKVGGRWVIERSKLIKFFVEMLRDCGALFGWRVKMNAIRFIADSENKPLKLSSIKVDGGTQSRASVSDLVVAEYAQAMNDGASFPPIVIFYDGADYWLADGFHRYGALIANGEKDVVADIRQGTRRDAILFSVGANASHGLRRSHDDKRRAAMTLLDDAEWSSWSDREIARQCAVSHVFVGKLRPVTGNVSSEDRTYTTKHGTVSTMDTSAIGKLVRQLAEEDTPEDGHISPALKTEEYPIDASNFAHISEDALKTEDISASEEITEEDLASDPAFQKAVDAFANAKAAYDEALAAPAGEPMTPEREANLRRVLGTREDRSNLLLVIKMAKAVAALPPPKKMAATVPPALNHTVDVLALLDASNWFEKFARAWEAQEGTDA